MLLLAITDQFGEGSATAEKARELLPRLDNEYQRSYYEGIICERQGKAAIARQIPDSKYIAYDWFYSAMELYEKAEKIRPTGNDDAILRWNTCVRLIEKYKLEPKQEELDQSFLE